MTIKDHQKFSWMKHTFFEKLDKISQTLKYSEKWGEIWSRGKCIVALGGMDAPGTRVLHSDGWLLCRDLDRKSFTFYNNNNSSALSMICLELISNWYKWKQGKNRPRHRMVLWRRCREGMLKKVIYWMADWLTHSLTDSLADWPTDWQTDRNMWNILFPSWRLPGVVRSWGRRLPSVPSSDPFPCVASNRGGSDIRNSKAGSAEQWFRYKRSPRAELWTAIITDIINFNLHSSMTATLHSDSASPKPG